MKLMVVRRFDPELANRVFLEMGARELKFIQNFSFFFGFVPGIPVAVLMHFVDAWWLLPILGVIIGYITNWVALWMIYEPAEPEQVGPFRLQGLFIRRQPEVAGCTRRSSPTRSWPCRSSAERDQASLPREARARSVSLTPFGQDFCDVCLPLED